MIDQVPILHPLHSSPLDWLRQRAVLLDEDPQAAEGFTALAAMDLLIASHALALDRTLVSHDQVFASLPGLLCCLAC